jgi:hypothetical protein
MPAHNFAKTASSLSDGWNPADNRAVVSLSGDHVASLNQRSGHRGAAGGQSYEAVTRESSGHSNKAIPASPG